MNKLIKDHKKCSAFIVDGQLKMSSDLKITNARERKIAVDLCKDVLAEIKLIEREIKKAAKAKEKAKLAKAKAAAKKGTAPAPRKRAVRRTPVTEGTEQSTPS